MNILGVMVRLNALSARVLNPLQPLFALGLRVWVGWQFLKAGWLKFSAWENTLFLFQEEYRVPVLPGELAAVVGTAGELIFPVLLIAGLMTRFAAFGLSAVNVMAVVAYAHVLLSEGFEAALSQHYLWGFMLLVIVVYGPGRLSLDALLDKYGERRAVSGVDRVTSSA